MKPLKQRETLETVFANVHYRKSEKETCLTCKNRIWVLLHDADGNALGPAFRCPVTGIEYPIAPDRTCDKHRPVRQVQHVVEPERLTW